MVDFNNETTITRPRQDILVIMMLQRRQEALDKYTEYNISKLKQTNREENRLKIFQAYVLTLLEEIRSMLEEDWKTIKKNTYNNIEELENDINSDEEEKTIKAYRFIDKYLYIKKLTRADTKDKLDRTDIISMNEYAGL